jgi:hypothetical protein
MIENDDVPVTSTVTLQPDPRLLRSMGRNHDLPSALADLVDNSIDAMATHVRIRFVRRGNRLIRLYVTDDGDGISDAAINTAMTIGGVREYKAGELGHFGIGLKAASFGHADELTVLSKTADGGFTGRRWTLDGAQSGFECDVVDPTFARDELREQPPAAGNPSGTIVRWDSVRTFPVVSDERETNRYLTETVEKVRRHLGIVFHRLLRDETVEILIDEFDTDLRAAGSAVPVDALDPFDYAHSGHPEYPKTLRVDSDPAHQLICHLWPPRSTTRQFRLDDRPESHQGIYVYRNNRLIQAGGWNGVIHGAKELQLARVVLDLTPGSEALVRLNPEKSRIEPTEAFVRALQQAAGDEVTLEDYLDDARALYKRGRRREALRPRVILPGKGLPPAVKRAIRTELRPMPNEDPIDIRWGRVEGDVLFDIDREARVLTLNRRYRASVTGTANGSLNDAPLIKTCLYLLVENVFQGHYLGSRDKDNIELWQSVLTAAAAAQR